MTSAARGHSRRWAIWAITALSLALAAGPARAKPCNDTLWRHVYHPERLIVKEICVTVIGTIVDATHGKRKDGLRHESDGDSHGWLKLDRGQEQFINAGNKSDEGGNLVFEVVCLFKVSQKDAIQTCKGYKSHIVVPPVGSHVRMSGSWVQDTNHARWLELHPVSAIQVIP